MIEARHFDVLVVGSGPAGIAAAVAAAESGAHVAMVDAQSRPGGQIWRDAKAHPKRQARRWLNRLRRADVAMFPGAQVVDFPEKGFVLAESQHASLTLAWSKLILAAGARELFLPFPGWTLPNVVGAGGLQALVKSGLDVRDRRILVAGSGPLLWAAADCASRAGADAVVIAEQAPGASIAQFARGLVRYPGKLIDAARMRLQLAGVSFKAGTWPVRALGSERVREVEFTDGRHTWIERADYLACAFGLVPQLELPQLAGCAIDRHVVHVNEWQETSVQGVYGAGEATGVGGVHKALEEGLIAGYAAAGRQEEARAHFVGRANGRRFADMLAHAFALRAELKALATDNTIVCRCEDVAHGQLRSFTSWREAKLFTRCGMGACQGRVCGPATRVLYGFGPDRVRPPAFPARLESLAAAGGLGQRMEGSHQAQ